VKKTKEKDPIDDMPASQPSPGLRSGYRLTRAIAVYYKLACKCQEDEKIAMMNITDTRGVADLYPQRRSRSLAHPHNAIFCIQWLGELAARK
jgi:hypothetical protein